MSTMQDALVKAGLASEKQIEIVEAEKVKKQQQAQARRQREHDKQYRNPNSNKGKKSKDGVHIGNNSSKLAFFAMLGGMFAPVLKEMRDKTPKPVLCGKCGAKGVDAVLGTVIIDEYMEIHGLAPLGDPDGMRAYGEGMRKFAEEKYGNLVGKDGCWKCPNLTEAYHEEMAKI